MWIHESSSPGRAGSCLILLATLLWTSSTTSWSGSGEPRGMALLLAVWAGRWFTGGILASSLSSAASTCPDRTCIFLAIDAMMHLASRRLPHLYSGPLYLIHRCLFIIACPPRSLHWGHCISCPSSLLSFGRSISHNSKC